MKKYQSVVQEAPLPLGHHRQVTPLLCGFVRRRIGRIGCALFSSNWYCLAHGRVAASVASVMPTLLLLPPPSPPLLALQYHHQARSVSQPAACWPKSQVEASTGEGDTNIRCGQVDEEPFFLLDIACGAIRKPFVLSQPNLDPSPASNNIAWAAH